MQKKNGSAVHQACAACKHQRKKCSQDCVLAPFFPPEKSSQFQVVHKVFGVSNISKLVKNLRTYNERVKAINTLVWEAQWWQADPVLGCYGEYKKKVEELKLLRETMKYKPGLIGWNNTNGIGVGVGVGVNYNNTINFISSNGNLILESTPYNHASNEQGQEKDHSAVCPPHSVDSLDQHYYLPDQYGRENVEMDATIWDGRS